VLGNHKHHAYLFETNKFVQTLVMAGSKNLSTSRQSCNNTTVASSRSASIGSIPSATTTIASTKQSTKQSKGKLQQAPAETPPSEHARANDDSTVDDAPEKVVSTSRPPKELFVINVGPIKSVGNEVTVNSIVVKKIFPHVKFVCDPEKELTYTDDVKSICSVVRSCCTPPYNVPERKWWDTARKWVAQQIAVLRSSKNTRLKWSVMGE
jgi:hypothetical protein